MKASVIVPTYNKLSRLKLALSTLKHQTIESSDYEIIVVNDGSDDGTKEYLSENIENYSWRLIDSLNSGRAAARNLGVEHAKGDILIFCDDDLLMNPGFIQSHIESHEGCYNVVHGKILNYPYLKFCQDPTSGKLYEELNKNQESDGILESYCLTETDVVDMYGKIVKRSKISKFEKMISTALKKNHKKISWIGCTGGNISLTQEMFRDVGGFDEALGRDWGCEDLELGYRLLLKDCNIVYCEAAMNIHIQHARVFFEKELVKSFSYFYEKHGDETIVEIRDILLGKKDFDELLH